VFSKKHSTKTDLKIQLDLGDCKIPENDPGSSTENELRPKPKKERNLLATFRSESQEPKITSIKNMF
jgi:hypothetical protein